MEKRRFNSFALITAIALILLLTASALFAAVFLGGDQPADFDNGIQAAAVALEQLPGSNGVVPEGYTGEGVRITNANELKSFLTGSDTNGWLANDITDFAWDSGERRVINKTLDGAGHILTIAGSAKLQVFSGTLASTAQYYGGTGAVTAGYVAARMENVTLKNINFISEVAPSYGRWQTTLDGKGAGNQGKLIGLVAGYFGGTMTNCSITVNGRVEFNVRSNQASNNFENHFHALGGFFGMAAGSTIENCEVNLNNNLTYRAATAKTTAISGYGYVRVALGGAVGTLQGGVMRHTSINGSGTLDADAVKEGSIVSADFMSFAGGLVGLNGNDTSEGITTTKSACGVIDGVISTWTGKTWQSSNTSTSPLKNDGDWTKQNLVGLLGTWNTMNKALRNVYFLNMPVPQYLCSYHFAGSNTYVAADMPAASVYLNDPAKGTISFGWEDTGAESQPLVRFRLSDADKAANTIVWKLNGRRQLNKETEVDYMPVEAYKTIDTVARIGELQDIVWTGIPRTIDSNLATYKVSATFGTAVYYGAPIKFVDDTDMEWSAEMNAYVAASKVYDGSTLVSHRIRLYRDAAHASLLTDKFISDAMWEAYKGDASGIKYSLANAKDAGLWTVNMLGDEAHGIDFAVANEHDSDRGSNYVAYTKDNQKFSIKREITPKPVSVQFDSAIADVVYNGQNVVWQASVIPGELVAGDSCSVGLDYYVREDGTEFKAPGNAVRDVGDYTVKTGTLSNPNYTFYSPLSQNFAVTQATLTLTWNDKAGPQFVYDGTAHLASYSIAGKTYKGDTSNPVEITLGEGEKPDFEIGGMYDETFGMIVSVSYDNLPFPMNGETNQDVTDATYTNAGYYRVKVSLNMGGLADNYKLAEGAETIHVYYIDRATVTVVGREKTVTYNGSYHSPDYDLSGIVGGDSGISTQFTDEAGNVYEQDSVKNAGVYSVRLYLEGGYGTFNNNYKSVEATTKLTVEKAAATVAFENTAVSKVYDGLAEEFTAAIASGIMPTEAANFSITGYRYLYTPLGAAEGTEPIEVDSVTDAGVYRIVALHNISDNYVVTGTTYDFTVEKLAVTVRANAFSKTYGDANPDFTGGWAYAEGSAAFIARDNIVLTLACDAGNYEAPGAYAIHISDIAGGKDNYEVTLEANTALEVKHREVAVAFAVTGADANSRAGYKAEVYAVGDPVYTYTGEFAVPQDNAPVYEYLYYAVGADGARTPITADAVKDAGEYVIVYALSEASQAYYRLADGKGGLLANNRQELAFGIDKLTVRVDTADESGVYGAEIPAFHWSYTIGSGAEFFASDNVALTAVTEATPFSGAGSYGITVSAAENARLANYDIVLANMGTFSVMPKSVTAEFTVATDVVYNGQNRADKVSVSFIGTVNNDTVTGKLTFNGAAEAIDAATYETVVSIDENNYVLTGTKTTTFVINARPVTVIASDMSLKYGAPVPSQPQQGLEGAFWWTYEQGSLQFLSSDSVTFGARCGYTQYANAGSTFDITLFSDASSNYAVTYRSGVLTVEKLDITASLTSLPQDSDYNGNVRTATAAANGVLNNDVVELEIFYNGAAQALDAGTYTVTCVSRNGNYNVTGLTDEVVSFTIRPVAIRFNVEDAFKGYSSSLIRYQDESGNWVEKQGWSIESGAFVSGDENKVAVTVAAAPYILENELSYLNKGAQNNGVVIVLSGEKAANYTVEYAYQGTLSVIANTVKVISLENTEGVYDGTNQYEKVVLKNANLADFDFALSKKNAAGAWESVTEIVDAGEYQLVLTVKEALQPNYDPTDGYTATFVYTVTKRIVEIGVDGDYELTYGDQAPVYDWAYGFDSLEFAATDNVTVTVSSEYTNTSGVGSYLITIASSADANPNYEVRKRGALVNVSPKALTVTVDPGENVVYNGAEQGVSVSVDGYVNGDTEFAYSVTYIGPQGNAVSGVPVNAGRYTAKVTLQLGDNANYSCTETSEIFVIAQKTVSVTYTMPSGMTYNALTKEVTALTTGILDADIAKLQIEVLYNGSAIAPINAGVYEITVRISSEDGTARNYLVDTKTDTTMTIGKRTLQAQITAEENAIYDGLAHDVTKIDYKGLQESDKASSLGVVVTYNGRTDLPINAGEYTIALTLDHINYTFGEAAIEKVFSIAKRTVAVDGRDVTLPDLTYDGSAKTIQVSARNVVEGDELILDVTYGGARIDAGTYDFRVSLGENENYVLAEDYTGSFTVTPRALTVYEFVLPENLVYDGTEKTVTVVFNGVIGLDAVGYTVTYNDAASAVDAGVYALNVALNADVINYTLGGDTTAEMTIAKASRTIDSEGITVEVRYNKLTVSGADGMLLSTDGETWTTESVFEAQAETDYTIYVKAAESANYRESNTLTFGGLRTGYDPTAINAKLNALGDFGFDDIAAYREIETLTGRVAAIDKDALDTAKLNAAKKAYEDLVAGAKEVVGTAQNNAAGAAGRTVGTAAAAAMGASLLAMTAFVVLKRKFL